MWKGGDVGLPDGGLSGEDLLLMDGQLGLLQAEGLPGFGLLAALAPLHLRRQSTALHWVAGGERGGGQGLVRKNVFVFLLDVRSRRSLHKKIPRASSEERTARGLPCPSRQSPPWLMDDTNPKG